MIRLTIMPKRIESFLMDLTSNDMLTVQNQKGDLSHGYVAT